MINQTSNTQIESSSVCGSELQKAEKTLLPIAISVDDSKTNS